VALLPYFEGGDVLYKQFKLNEPWDSEHNLGLLAKMPDVFTVGFEPKGATHTYYQRFALTSLGPAAAAGGGADGGAGGSGVGGIGAPPVSGSGTPPGISVPAPATAPASGAPPTIGGPPGLAAGGGPGPGFGGAPEPPAVPRFPLQFHEIIDGTSNTLGVIEAGPPVPWSKPADFVYDPRQPLPKMTGPFANVRNVGAMDGTVYGLKPDLNEHVWRNLINANDGLPNPGWKELRAQFPVDTEEEKKALAKLLEDNQALITKLEEQFKEHTALLGLTGKLTKDIDRAEADQARIQQMIENLRAMNKKMRDDLGLRPGGPVPGGR
jgi:hypothetical protein